MLRKFTICMLALLPFSLFGQQVFEQNQIKGLVYDLTKGNQNLYIFSVVPYKSGHIYLKEADLPARPYPVTGLDKSAGLFPFSGIEYWKGRLWINTKKGVLSTEEEGQEFKSTGLEEPVFGLLSDEEHLFAWTPQGLYSYQNGKYQLHSLPDSMPPLPDPELIYAFCQDHDEVFFWTNKGMWWMHKNTGTWGHGSLHNPLAIPKAGETYGFGLALDSMLLLRNQNLLRSAVVGDRSLGKGRFEQAWELHNFRQDPLGPETNPSLAVFGNHWLILENNADINRILLSSNGGSAWKDVSSLFRTPSLAQFPFSFLAAADSLAIVQLGQTLLIRDIPAFP